jgi:glycosyltransferase involved in cell wall biosynthesis
VTIFRNAASFFEEAIDSVLTQTYADWELLLVDDGAEDGSDELALQYVDRFPERIRYLAHDGRVNRGTARSRNLGVENARGRYVAELDADDVWQPQFLERRVAALEREPNTVLAFSPVLRWYSWSGAAEDAERDWIARPWDSIGETIEPPSLLPILLERAPAGGVPKGWLIRREAILAVGGYPEEFRDMYEDQALLCMIGLTGRARYLGECDYYYRRHVHSMVSVLNRTRDPREMRARFLGWLQDYLRRIGNVDGTVHRSLRRELRRCHYPRLTRLGDHLAALPARVVRKLVRLARKPDERIA